MIQLKPRYKKLLKLCLISLLGVFLALIFAELSLRFYQFAGEKQILNVKPNRTTITWQDNPVIGKVLLSPNTKGFYVSPTKEYFSYIKANSLGFNDTEHTFTKPKNTYRIVFLGDSFVASLQTPLDQTFFKQIEKKLNQSSKDKKYEVIALGMGDTGTAQQYLALKEIGIKYHPDLVIQMFLTANDIKNNSLKLMADPYRPYFILDAKNNLELLPHPMYSKRDNSLIKNQIKGLYLVELLLNVRQKLQELKHNKSVDYPIDYHVYDVNYSNDYKDSWNVTQKLLLESKKLVEDSGGKYEIVTLANNEQVNTPVIDGIRKTYPKFGEANVDLRKPDTMIMQFCLEKKVNCSQMLQSFIEYKRIHPDAITHFFNDGHWNQIGTNIAANYLLSTVVK